VKNILKPEEIEQESFRIIHDEMGDHSFTIDELAIVTRVIHATADFDFARILRFSAGSIEEGIYALRNGCRLVTDVQMIAAGVNQPRLEQFGCPIRCLVNDPEVITIARKSGKTRSEIAMQQFGPELSGAIVAIGNAPTALFEVLRLFEENQIQPALVVGVPVGFVNAAESKQALANSSLHCITTCGRKGGSTIAVSILNALLRLAGA
jgi:precorrin-8X/cobalt-precorrin-8 methylmutase